MRQAERRADSARHRLSGQHRLVRILQEVLPRRGEQVGVRAEPERRVVRCHRVGHLRHRPGHAACERLSSRRVRHLDPVSLRRGRRVHVPPRVGRDLRLDGCGTGSPRCKRPLVVRMSGHPAVHGRHRREVGSYSVRSGGHGGGGEVLAAAAVAREAAGRAAVGGWTGVAEGAGGRRAGRWGGP